MPELTYTQRGDYLLPDIVLSDPPDAEPLTKYGMMLTREELYPHCRAVQRQAEGRMDELMSQLTKRNPPPDKAACSLTWAQHMATLHHTAEEIIFAELIYA